MTNKEYLLTLSDKECAEKIVWLWAHYSLCYTDSLLAIEQWLGEEHKGELSNEYIGDNRSLPEKTHKY